MASYKILFLDFCYKNEPRRKVKTTFALQNASNQGQFVNYDDNGVSLASQQYTRARGTMTIQGKAVAQCQGEIAIYCCLKWTVSANRSKETKRAT